MRSEGLGRVGIGLGGLVGGNGRYFQIEGQFVCKVFELTLNIKKDGPWEEGIQEVGKSGQVHSKKPDFEISSSFFGI